MEPEVGDLAMVCVGALCGTQGCLLAGLSGQINLDKEATVGRF